MMTNFAPVISEPELRDSAHRRSAPAGIHHHRNRCSRCPESMFTMDWISVQDGVEYALGEGVEDGDDLTQRPTEPGEFADDQTVAVLEDIHQLVEPAALFGSLSRGGRLDEIVDLEVVFACVL